MKHNSLSPRGNQLGAGFTIRRLRPPSKIPTIQCMNRLSFLHSCKVATARVLALGICALVPLAGWSAPHPRYRITDLGSTAFGSAPLALNNHGDVVGLTLSSNGIYRPALFHHGTVAELPLPAGTGGGFAFDINDAGDIIGHYWSGQHHSPFLLRSGALIDLNAQTGLDLELAGINNAGVIAARNWHGLNWEPATWSNGVVRTFGHLTTGYPVAINNRGEVLVNYYSATAPGPGTATAIIRDDRLSAVAEFMAWGFNDVGDVVGDLSYVAFLYSPDGSRSLGALRGDLYSKALRINNAGQIIGLSEDNDDDIRPFLFTGKKIYNFTQVVPRGSGYTIGSADDINEQGQIAAKGFFRGESRALLLTPVKQLSKPLRNAGTGRPGSK